MNRILYGDEVTGAQKKFMTTVCRCSLFQAGCLINGPDSLFEVTDFQVWIIFTGLLSSETGSYLVQIIQAKF